MLRVSGVVVSVVEISVTGWLIPDVLRHPVTRHYIPEERRLKYLYHFPNHLHEMLQPEQIREDAFEVLSDISLYSYGFCETHSFLPDI